MIFGGGQIFFIFCALIFALQFSTLNAFYLNNNGYGNGYDVAVKDDEGCNECVGYKCKLNYGKIIEGKDCLKNIIKFCEISKLDESMLNSVVQDQVFEYKSETYLIYSCQDNKDANDASEDEKDYYMDEEFNDQKLEGAYALFEEGQRAYLLAEEATEETLNALLKKSVDEAMEAAKESKKISEEAKEAAVNATKVGEKAKLEAKESKEIGEEAKKDAKKVGDEAKKEAKESKEIGENSNKTANFAVEIGIKAKMAANESMKIGIEANQKALEVEKLAKDSLKLAENNQKLGDKTENEIQKLKSNGGIYGCKFGIFGISLFAFIFLY